MRRPAITFDAIFTAIAVLGAGAGCSKAERAAAEPPATAPAASAATTATAVPTAPSPPAEEVSPPSPQAAATTSAAVDAGIERSKVPSAKKAGGSAACGATGCSAEMRKGGK